MAKRVREKWVKYRNRRRHGGRGPRASPPSEPVSLSAGPAAPQPPSVIRFMGYGPQAHVEKPIEDAAALRDALDQWPVKWVDAEGLSDPHTLDKLGAMFRIHHLALEDVVNTHQRAKVEQYEGHLFIVVRMVDIRQGVETEQISLFLGPDYVITFQEGRPGDNFDGVRDRIRKNIGTIRHAGADYLAYCLLDGVIDGYFPVLEVLGEDLEALEDEILARPAKHMVSRIYEVKRALLTMRRAVWPVREALNALVRDACPLVGDETRLHLRDCYDHVVRVIDLIETYREIGSDLMDLYLSSVSQRMNEVMKVLTIIATIFIPLTFISGLYGMNFNTEVSPWNMPELNWRWGYPAVLAVMAAVAAALLAFFGWKGWLTAASETEDEPKKDGHDRHIDHSTF